MTLLDALLLGLVQGLTEFLPISSSGHLVLAQHLLGADPDGVGSLSFEILVHLGTLLAVLLYFRAQVARLFRALYNSSDREGRLLILWIVVGTIPAVIAGLFLKINHAGIFSSATLAASMLLVNGAVLLLTGLIQQGGEVVGFRAAALIGLAQACALLPGISRSGSTISAGMFLKVDPEKAAEFSFLLAIPAILGAAILDIEGLAELSNDTLLTYLAGTVVAFLSGLAAISWLMRLIRGGKFLYFGVYCIVAGGGALLLI